MDTLTEQKVETFLPVFPGFYETIWQFDSDNMLIENINELRAERGLAPIDWDALELDYKTYELDLCKHLCDVMARLMQDYVSSITFETVQSPREYNFRNDSVDCGIVPNVDSIKKFLLDNWDKFGQYLKARYTSYDGFISHYSNDPEDWKAETKGFTDWTVNGHYLGSVLEFIASIQDITDYTLYEEAEVPDACGYVTNWDAVMEFPACTHCRKPIENTDTITALKKYRELMGRGPREEQ